MNEQNQRIDFDDYAERYEEMLHRQLSFFSSDRDYFSDYKTRILARLLPVPPARVLDFGCGIGLSLPHLAARFPDCALAASDISSRSLERVARNFPKVEAIPDDLLDRRHFDLIFVAGVFHHIPPEARPTVMHRLAGLLEPGGSLCVFEQNSYNPVTRRLVATCPFDADAILLPRRELKGLFADAGLKVSNQGYCLFFPPGLKGLTRLEAALGWLPLGGQYFVLGGR